MLILRRYALFSSLLLFACLWRHHCGYAFVDLRRSTATCVVPRGGPPSAAALSEAAALDLKAAAPDLDVKPREPPAHVSRAPLPCAAASLPPACLAPHRVRSLSPGWLARRLGDAGPLLVWLPLVWAAAGRRAEPCGGAGGRLRAALGLACLVYLAAIMPVRYLRRALPGGFDPSGHVFLFGVQLVPLWAAVQVWAVGDGEGAAGGAVAAVAAAGGRATAAGGGRAVGIAREAAGVAREAARVARRRGRRSGGLKWLSTIATPSCGSTALIAALAWHLHDIPLRSLPAVSPSSRPPAATAAFALACSPRGGALSALCAATAAGTTERQ